MWSTCQCVPSQLAQFDIIIFNIVVYFKKAWYHKITSNILFQPISCATLVYELMSRMTIMFEYMVEEECDFARNLSTNRQDHCLRYQQVQNYHRSLVSSFGVILVENSMPFPTVIEAGLPTRTLSSISLNRHRQDYIFFAKSIDVLQYVDNYLLLISQNTSPRQFGTLIPVTSDHCGHSYQTDSSTCPAFS